MKIIKGLSTSVLLISMAVISGCGNGDSNSNSSTDPNKTNASLNASNTSLDGVWIANFGYGGQNILTFTIVGTDIYFEDFFMCRPNQSEPLPFYKLTKKSEDTYELNVNLENECAKSMEGFTPDMPLPRKTEIKLDGQLPTKEMKINDEDGSKSLVRLSGPTGRFKYWEVESMKRFRPW